MIKMISKWCLKRISYAQIFALFYLLLPSSTTIAQIAPDPTLPIDSVLENGGSNTTIVNGGTAEGSNLFHSFERFNVITGTTVYFNNIDNIQNIFSRVTGSSVSNIDGILRANGSANLFLINRNGIIFGPNASLNIGGSFLATTAESINFADGAQFSTKPAQTAPLLTVSVPIGLNLESSSGKITVQGSGHSLVGQNFRPVTGTNQLSGLKVQPGNNIFLVGGDVDLVGGLLTAPGGHIGIGSINNGTVSLNLDNSDWALNYNKALNFGDIRLSTRSLIDTSGFGSGSIQLQGNNISLADGSVIIIQNQGLLPSGEITLNALDSIKISGTDPIAKIPGSVRTETLTSGKAGDIVISTPNLTIIDGGAINAVSYSTGGAGSIFLRASDSIQIIGNSPRSLRTASTINSLTFSDGDAGDILIETNHFTARDGGILVSNTAGNGAGGNIKVDAKQSIELVGFQSSTLAPSSIGASTSGMGDAGSVILDTGKLLVENGGRVDSSTVASGTAGTININASDSVEVKGTVPNSRNPSLIISSGNILDESLRASFGLSEGVALTGDSGNLKVTTRKLTVRDGGLISVNNEGLGDAGTLEVFADSIFLDNKGGITAATASGQGGTLSVETERLQLTNNSNITATANGGSRNGGNVTINTDTLVALEDSDITANAFEGRGGNIQITTQGLFRSPDSTISASSKLGINGTVSIQTLGFDVSNTITPLQNNLISPEQIVAGSCLARRNAERSSFVVTGSGSLPVNPYSEIEEWEIPSSQSQSTLLDSVQPENNYQGTRSPLTTPSPKKWKLGDPIIEAQGIVRLSDGRVLLGMKPQRPASAESLICKS